MKWTLHQNGQRHKLDGDGFTISYIEHSLRILPDSDGGETALIDERNGVRRDCLVLNGDFRKEYEAAADQGYDACKAVYDQHKAKHRSRWSEDDDAHVTPEEGMIILGRALSSN